MPRLRHFGAARVPALLCLLPALHAQSTLREIWVNSGTGGGDQLGYAIASLGDVDGDGRPDLVAGAPLADHQNGIDAGSASILSGATGQVIRVLQGLASGDRFGTAVAGVGDVNGDFWPDVIVGAPGDDDGGKVDCGSATVFSGFDGSVLWTVFGDASGDEAGYAVGAAGDLDRDGRTDFIVGMHLADQGALRDVGLARIYSGRTRAVLWERPGEREGDHFGAWVGEVGDVDRDGWQDFCVTAPWADVDFLKSGSAYVYSGRTGTQLFGPAPGIANHFHGQGGGHEFGTSFAKCGDMDGDGHADLWIAEPEHKRNGDDSGSARLISGRTGQTLHQFFGARAYDYFGLMLDAGDVDGDGRTDLIATAFLEDTGAPNGGAVFVFSGAGFTPIMRAFGTARDQQLGRSVAFAGDLNGDGLGDLAAGMPGWFGAGANSGGVRAWCGMPTSAMTLTFGSGCPATQPLQLSYSGTPRPGLTFQAHLAGAAAVSQAWLVFATRSYPELDLGFAGMPGCKLYQPLDVLVPVGLTSGTATVPLAIPPSAVVCGLRLANQAIGWWPGINPTGVVTSNGGVILATQ